MRARRQGLSLAEAIVACFVMTAAMIVSAALYNSALNQSVRIDRMHRASRVAERRLEEIRAWSREQHGTNGPLPFNEGWGAYDGVVTQDSEYPEFEVTTRVITRDLYSPSSAFEDIRFAAQADETVPDSLKDEKRQLPDSSYLIEVVSKWGEGPKESFTARTLIADPVKDYGWPPDEAWKAIELTNTPANLSPNGFTYVSAVVKDANGHEVRNAVVQWYVDPNSSGNGTLEVNPDFPSRAKFINAVEVDKDPDVNGDELTVYTGGSARIVARIRLGGVEAINKTDAIVLETPPE